MNLSMLGGQWLQVGKMYVIAWVSKQVPASSLLRGKSAGSGFTLAHRVADRGLSDMISSTAFTERCASLTYGTTILIET